jgi:hypothetical protein
MRPSRSLLIVTARCLLVVDSLMWTVFAVLLWSGVVHVGDVSSTIVALLAALMLCNAAALGLFAWQALRGRKLVDSAAVVLMAVNAVLSLADEVGVSDIAVFALTLLILVLLVLAIRVSRREQFDPEPALPA